MVEEIITALSHTRWLLVIARNSSFTYKGRAVDVKQVGREFGVLYVLEGSVRQAGNSIRITAQLLDAQCLRFLASCYAHMGRLGDAQAIVEKLRQITPDLIPSAKHWRIAGDREYYLDGLRLAVDATLEKPAGH